VDHVVISHVCYYGQNELVKEERHVGLRLSPIYDRGVRWLDDPVCYPLWKKVKELGCTFNIFLAPHQVDQVANMAERVAGSSTPRMSSVSGRRKIPSLHDPHATILGLLRLDRTKLLYPYLGRTSA
jgi:hypothetical protein